MSQLSPFLSIKGANRYHKTAPSKDFLQLLREKYDFHEIIEEDLEEKTTQDKIDVYDDHLFVVLHFPKYNLDRQKYLLNEFSIILTKDSIVTLTKYQTSQIEKIKKKYEQDISEKESDEDYKISPYYILYRIIDVMYDKLLKGLLLFSRDLREIEDRVFDYYKLDQEMLERVMTKRRNLVTLKHSIIPQQEILKELQEETLKFFGGELDVYFEDLESKIEKILGTISILNEDIESLYDTYNAMLNMKTNSIITVLTIFTAIVGVMTLITGWYGMNIMLPGSHNPFAMFYIIAGMLLIGLFMLLFFKKKNRI